MPKAYSYLRFSTPEQMKGDSYRRQSTLAQEYAARHGLELDDKLTFKDLGVSAFRGKNAEGGQLGAFLAAVQVGKVEPGSYLLVESLDRISRQAAFIAMGTLTSILAHGINLVTLSEGKLYSQATMTAQPWDLMWAIMGFIRANDESAVKSMRLKACWKGRRDRVREKPMTSTAPLWLRLDKESGRWTVLEESAAVVRRIFRDYLDGKGAQTITRDLNSEGVPPFSRPRADDKRNADRWHRATIRKLLVNPAVIGTYTPNITEYVDGRQVRKAAQKPIPGYFPAIIEEETFRRARALALDTPSPCRGKNANTRVKNVFGGLVRCGRCESLMTYVTKGASSKGPLNYLVCTKARAGAGCKYQTVRYERLEAMFFQHASELLGTALLEPGFSPLDAEIRDAEAALSAAEDTIMHLTETYARTRLVALLDQIKVIQDEKAGLQKKLDRLYDRAGVVSCPLVSKRIQELEQALQADPLDRSRVNALLRMLFKSMTVDLDGGVAGFTWKHGGAGEVRFGFPRDDAKAGEAAKAA
jgi:DNA invertase Pin-like site-specific DNA recombinase